MSATAISNLERNLNEIVDNLENIKRMSRSDGDLDKIRRKASHALDATERAKREIHHLKKASR